MLEQARGEARMAYGRRSSERQERKEWYVGAYFDKRLEWRTDRRGEGGLMTRVAPFSQIQILGQLGERLREARAVLDAHARHVVGLAGSFRLPAAVDLHRCSLALSHESQYASLFAEIYFHPLCYVGAGGTPCCFRVEARACPA